MTPAAVFVLVAVTYGGTVSSSNYPSVHACEEAKSLALYGVSAEDKAAQDAAAAIRARAYEKAMSAPFGLVQLFVGGSGTVTMIEDGMVKTALCFQDVGANN